MLYWILPFLLINCISASTKPPTIYVEVIDTKKLANIMGKPIVYNTNKREISNPFFTNIDKIKSKILSKNKKRQLQSLILKEKELEKKIVNQERQKSEKVSRRVLLESCLKEGKAELDLVRELIRARQLRLNNTLALPLFKNDTNEDVELETSLPNNSITINPQVVINIPNSEEIINKGDIPQSALYIPSSMLQIPSPDYISNGKPLQSLPEYTLPKFYWPSPNVRPYQAIDSRGRLYKRFDVNKTDPLSNIFEQFANNRLQPFKNNAPLSYFSQHITPKLK